MSQKIVVVEDDINIAELLRLYLEKDGFEVLIAHDGGEGLHLAETENPDLVMLDIMLPGEDGLTILQNLRSREETADVPIIMVTAKSTEIDTVKGLDQGADDYITKPFKIREVMARIKANLRKAELNANMDVLNSKKNDEKDDIIKVGDLSLDLKKVEAKVKGEVINLTKKEFDVLKYLASQPGQVVTREMLLREVWEYEEYVGAIRTIDVTMNRIRDKIEKDKANPKILITKRGVGYYVTDKT